MEAIKISFAVKSVSDQVVSIGNGTYNNITVQNLADSNKQYWLQKDTNGNQHLCTCGTELLPLDAVFFDGTSSYPLRAVNFEVVELVGGRPEHRPHAY